MKVYQMKKDEVVKVLESSEKGLSHQIAKERLVKYGENKLEEAKKVPLWRRFVDELMDPMILVLLVAALVSAITAIYANESLAEVFIILAVVVINSALGVYQESKAEKAIEALNAMSSSMVKVKRDGRIVMLPSVEVTIGDVVLLEAGDAVCADGRVLVSASLKVEEAALTGESVPVEKHVDSIDGDVSLGDRKNMVYMGSTIVYGRGEMIVTSVGMDTEMGKIAHVLASTKEGQTPLQMKLNQLSKTLTYLVLGICVFMFIFSLYRADGINGVVIVDTFMVAVSLAVAAIPEGLAAVVTIVLSIGVTNMSKRNAIIRKLTAVETLGSAQIICSDKTGTLTQNKMTVIKHYGSDEKLIAKAMALCSDSEIDEEGFISGEPTEMALVQYAHDLHLPKFKLKISEPRIGEVPFDSMRKLMSTIHKVNGKIVQYTKGAPDVLLSRCNYVLDNGKVIALDDIKRKEITKANAKMANEALRVLAVGYRIYEVMPKVDESIEQDLVFIGLVGMMDPVREEVVSAISMCKSAGIRPIMITGDHKDTAVAIARQLGILENSSAITGQELDLLSDEEFEKNIGKYSVYARVQPEHKSRIVNTWKKLGMITAMTGDGVNDAPSIKSADIGVGMGITGTDVTKNVADMVLADDNFATIVSAVEEGRKIYDNIRKAIQFLLSSNLSEVVSVFVSTLLGFTILKPIHILWINLVTDSFPALGLGMETGDVNVMKRDPRPSNEGIFANGLGFDVLYQGVLIAFVTIMSYFVGHYLETGIWEIGNSAEGMTMAFLTMSLAEIFHSFNMRSQRGSIFSIKSHNKYLYLAMIFSFVMTTLLIFVPFLRGIFGLTAISLYEYMIAIGMALLVIPVVEIVKWIQRRE